MTDVEQPPNMEVGAKRTSEMMRAFRANSALAVQLLIVFVTAAALFLTLRASDYLVVDGALRGLPIFQLGRPFLHENNHLLYPVNVYTWSVLLGSLGVRANNPLAFLGLVQAMNAFAAAGILTALYGLCFKLTGRIVVASLVTVGYGLSRAFLAHATNSAEPMVGLLWSGISVVLAVYGISHGKLWASFTGGLLLTLAMATYQSMVLLGVPVVFLLWQWPRPQGDPIGLRARITSVAPYAAGFTLGLPIIYGTAYYLSGTRTLGGLVGRFLHVTLTQEVYTRVTVVKIAGLLAGLAYSLFPCLPRECSGFRCLGGSQYQRWIPVAAIAVIIACLSLLAILRLASRLWGILTELEKAVLLCCAVGLISTMAPLIFLPTYDKLWLQPLAFLFVGSGMLVNAGLRANNPTSGTRRMAWWSCALVVAVGLLNLGRARSLSAGPASYLKEAQEVAAVVRPKDLLIGDRDGIYLLYQYFGGSQVNTFNVPTDVERNGPGTVARLSDAANRAEQAGGEVFFLGLLDLSEGEWQALIGARGGPPYKAFAEHRRCAEIVKSYKCEGRIVTLRRLGACRASAPFGHVEAIGAPSLRANGFDTDRSGITPSLMSLAAW